MASSTAAATASAYWNQLVRGKLGGGSSTSDPSSSNTYNTTNGADDAIESQIAAWAGDDTDLRRLLQQRPPDTLKELTEDEIVDYQLVQFPTYGTNMTLQQQHQAAVGVGAARGMDEDDFDEDDTGSHIKNSNNSPTAQHQQQARKNGMPASPKAEAWIQWVGGAAVQTLGGAAGFLVDEQQEHSFRYNDEEEGDLDDDHHNFYFDEAEGATGYYHHQGRSVSFEGSKQGGVQRQPNRKLSAQQQRRLLAEQQKRDAEWDPAEQMLWTNTEDPTFPNNSDSIHKGHAIANCGGNKPESPQSHQNHVSKPRGLLDLTTRANTTSTSKSNKQDWMPDVLCKHCYACEAPFTIIRRRHHCRLCGQVFCNACSAYFLHKHRVCQLCFEQAKQESKTNHSIEGATASTAPAISTISTSPSSRTNGGSAGNNNATTTKSAWINASVAAATSKEQPPPPPPPPPPSQHGTLKLTASSSTTTNTPPPPPPPPPPPLPSPTTILRDGHRHLGRCAADHLEALARHLLQAHGLPTDPWTHQLLTLATKCCATVVPDVKKRGDLLDIRPYVKIKCVPGGTTTSGAYLSGVMFRKHVSHKRMARMVDNPRILLIAGAIEFNPTQRMMIQQHARGMTSLETLFEQENAYMDILVGKILKVQPDVVLVGKAVSRRAQELLLEAGVVVAQHVKAILMGRIARQTGAVIVTNQHNINQLGPSVLGSCRRFRLVTFRDNEVWTEEKEQKQQTVGETATPAAEIARQQQQHGRKVKSIPQLLSDPNLKNHERQAALAANRLGEGVLDGAEAVKRGLAKRGVAHTYILLEGCPKELGCTVVLRGADQASLKKVKTVFKFLAGAAYSMHLETTFLKERGVRLHPDFAVVPQHTLSTSLAVDYGTPPEGRSIVRPWNGGMEQQSQRIDPLHMTAMDHQAILITSVWMTDRTQCCPAEVKGICYYSLQDVALGQFLRDSCFNLSLKCQNPNCKKSVLDHSLSFVHNDGLINIMVEEMDEPLQEDTAEHKNDDSDTLSDDELVDKPIATWTYCLRCKKIVSPLAFISDNTWKFSFGKFLEVFFYNRSATINSTECSCNAQQSSVLYFGCGKLAARFTYERVKPFGVFVRKTLPLDVSFHRQEAKMHLDMVSAASHSLFIDFQDHVENILTEARSLFNSAINRPEHLQTVYSELGKIGSEVSYASQILRERIETMAENFDRDDELANGSLFRIPLFIRRHVFNLATAWNEKLNAAGQAISAMKKISAANSIGDGAIGSNSAVDEGLNDELAEGMKRLHQLIEHYQRYNVMDINQVVPSLHGQISAMQDGDYDEYFDNPDASIDFADGVDADVLASRRRLKSSKQTQFEKPTKSLGTRRSTAEATRHDSSMRAPKSTPGGAVKSALTRFFYRGGRSDDKYSVDLGIFNEGRPRLPPGVDDILVPVVDEQLSSIIAYSLASTEYAKQFKAYAKTTSDGGGTDPLSSRRPDAPGAFDGSDKGQPFDQARGRQRALSPPAPPETERRGTERRMLNRNKSHIKHTFRDFDGKGQVSCKFVCTTYWATQFHSVRQGFLTDQRKKDPANDIPHASTEEIEQSYVESLSSAYSWTATGGKSGASFARTSDNRFVIKCISRTELQMFLDCAPAYFEYLSKAFFHGLPTVLCKIVGVYQIGIHNLETGKKNMEQVAVMQNMFYNKNISMIFDLKGSLRGRFAAHIRRKNADGPPENAANVSESGTESETGKDRVERTGRNDDNVTLDSEGLKSKQPAPVSGPSTLLDGDFLEFTFGRPMPLTDRAKAVFQMSILNDTLFLSIINVLDYSILVGLDEENMELVVGIIDFMRQYDILKQMERVGKSLPMVVGSEAPTIIQPPLYKARFTNAMERYFMTVPSKWTTI